jgi:hypothetical protein
MEANEDKHSLAELVIAKQRNGPIGNVKLSWDSTCTRFFDWTDALPTEGEGYAAVIEQGPEDISKDTDFSDLAI